jgi:pimeloyl-ACP methyl ester carboxylesterase
MAMKRLIAVLLLLTVVSCKVEDKDEPDLDIDCKFMTPKAMFNLCITRTKGSTNQDVIFQLHGVRGSQKEWINKWKPVRDIWRQRGFEPPAVATVNFGPAWFLAEKNHSKVSGLFGYYLNGIMPWIEKKLGYKARHRFLLGESMGGFNAAQYYFKRPEVFDKVAIICPAFTSIGPQSSKAEIKDYISRTHADKGDVNWLIFGLKVFFPKAEDWANADVFQLDKDEKDRYPPLLLSCGTEDTIGFYEGASKMAEILQADPRKEVHWYPIPGGHCARPFEQVADFFEY